MKIPPGVKVFNIEWLSEKVFVLTSLTQLRRFKKLNDIPDKVLCEDDWNLYDGSVTTAVNKEIRCFFLILKTPSLKTIVHESVHLADYILKHSAIKVEGEVLAYMVEHIFDKIVKCSKIKKIK